MSYLWQERKDLLPATEWSVKHKRVAVRSLPTTNAAITRTCAQDALVYAVETKGDWIRLVEGGWMLTDGHSLGLGALLAPTGLTRTIEDALRACGGVAASSSGASKSSRMESAKEWRITHSPMVVVRETANVKARSVGHAKHGDIVKADKRCWPRASGIDRDNHCRSSLRYGEWIHIVAPTSGWLLTHGKQLGLGALAERVRPPEIDVVLRAKHQDTNRVLCSLDCKSTQTVDEVIELLCRETPLIRRKVIPLPISDSGGNFSATNAHGRHYAPKRRADGTDFVWDVGLMNGDDFEFAYDGDIEADLAVPLSLRVLHPDSGCEVCTVLASAVDGPDAIVEALVATHSALKRELIVPVHVSEADVQGHKKCRVFTFNAGQAGGGPKRHLTAEVCVDNGKTLWQSGFRDEGAVSFV